jgi:Fe-S cluster assembly ATP-binding protein
MPLLEIEHLSYRAEDREILSDCSFAVFPGEIHSLIGPNGTGKSTLACLVMGCSGYRPDGGRILFGGRPIEGLPLPERAALGICMAWQEPARIEGLRVREYLLLKEKTLDPSPYLRMVGLSPERFLSRTIDRSLSGGERKRIELASVLSVRPKLAILDEPDSGIDMLSMGDIEGVVRAFRRGGASVLLITHREEMAQMADRASQICGGRIVRTGPPAEVVALYKEEGCGVCGLGGGRDVRARESA